MNQAVWILFAMDIICSCCRALQLESGIHFEVVLNKEDFFSSVNDVLFSASIDGHADLPKWMKLHQDHPSRPALLYGTPLYGGLGTTNVINIVGLNMKTYETRAKKVNFTIVFHAASKIKYQFEFKVKNKDLSDMFGGSSAILNSVKRYWPSAMDIVMCQAVPDRNVGSNPLFGQKEGVYLTVGGKQPALGFLLPCESLSASDQNKVFKDNGFVIDWCSSKSISLDPGSPQNGFADPDEFSMVEVKSTKAYEDGHDKTSFDLIYLFIPIAFAVIFTVIINCLFCCDQGSKKVILQRKRPPPYKEPPLIGNSHV